MESALYLPLLVMGIHRTMWWGEKTYSASWSSWKWEYQWNWDKPYCLRCKQWCPTRCNLAESKSVLKMCISKHCHEVTGFFSWIGTYCISCVVRQRSRVKDLSVVVGYDDSVLPRILGRAGGLMTQILIVLVQSICFDKLPFLFHASWVDCLSFPSWVVILLKMWALGFPFFLRISSLKGPHVCRSISRWLPFGETSASQV